MAIWGTSWRRGRGLVSLGSSARQRKWPTLTARQPFPLERLEARDPLGNGTTSVYDPYGLRTAVADPLDNRTSFTYDALRRLTEVRFACGNRFTTVYDALGRTRATVDPFDNRTSYGYDAVGNATSITDPFGQVWTTAYDGRRLPIASTDPLGNITTTSYDALGRPASFMDPLGHVTTSRYDADGRPLATVNALGHATTFIYDDAGRQTALWDANNHRTTFGYDVAGRQTLTLDALGNRFTSTYDAAGRLATTLDGRGARITFSYDQVGRQTLRNRSDGVRVTSTYDSVGNRLTMQDATGVTTYAYDALNRRTLAQSPGGLAITYSYDSRSLRSEMQDPLGGRFTYTYDSARRASTVKNPENRISTFAYDRTRRSGLRHGNNARVSYAYDTAGRLVDVNNMRSNGTSFERFTYTYDGAGNRTRVLELTGHRMTFSYDNANQLVREQRSDTVPDLNWDYTHTYDGVGNRTVWSDPGSDVNYSFDAANQVTADTYVTPYTYDAAGNMTRAVYLAPYTLTWDAENRLTRYEDGYFGIDNRYQYDGDGRRVRREALNPGSVFQYVWDFENVLLETDDNGALATRYTLEPEMFGNLLSDKVVYFFNAERYYHFDGLGSTRRLTNFQSTPLDATMHYEAFGFPRNAGDPFSSYRWLGQIGYQLQVIPGNGFLFGGYYDYANFYVRQRYYDRWTARWTSRDPLRADGRANLYAYVSNMPTILRDPMGLEPIYNPNAIEPKRDPCPDARPIQGPKQRGGNGDLYGPTPPFVFPDVSEGPKPGPMQGPIGPPNGMQGPVIGPSPGGMQPGKTPHYYVREYYYGYVAGSFIPGIYPIDPPNIQEVSEAEYHKAATERANNRRRTLAANLQTTGSPSGSNPYSPKPNWNPLTWWEPETVVWK